MPIEPIALPRARPWARLVPVAAFALALLAFGRSDRAGAADQGDAWRVVGRWEAQASGDDVRAMVRDGDGLWAGSAGGGVLRWRADGGGWRQYLAPQDGLPCNDVRDVVAWRGAWWFATCHGLARYDAAHDRMTAVGDGLPLRSLTALVVDDQDRLWVGATPHWDAHLAVASKATLGGWAGGGIAYSADGQEWTVFDGAAGLPSRDVRDLALWRGNVYSANGPEPIWSPPTTDPDGQAVPGRWMQSGGGVARFSDNRWTAWNAESSPELADAVNALAAGPTALWAATSGRGLVAWNGTAWKGRRDCGDDNRCIQDNYVTAVAVGADGAVWAATARFNGRGTGVALLDDRGTPADTADDGWFVLRGASALPGDLVHAILPEADASAWFGCSTQDDEGRVHGAGIAHLLDDRQSIVRLDSRALSPGAPASNDITVVARHPLTGELWIGTARSGLSVRAADGEWRTITRASTPGGLAGDSIADLAIEPNGTVWVATRQSMFDATRRQWTDGGLSRFDGQQWTRFSGSASGLPSDHLSALALDGRGKLWVGTGATDRGPKEFHYRGWGVAVIDTATGRWERTFTHPQLASNNVTDIALSGHQMWVSTAYFFYVDPRPGGAQFNTGGGLSVYDLDGGTWRSFTDKDGLPPAMRDRGNRALIDLRTLFADADGTVWAGGLSYPSAIIAADAPPDGIVVAVRSNALVVDRFDQSGAVVGLASDGQGAIWSATAADGLRVRPPDGRWIQEPAAPGGLPSNELTALRFDAQGGWFGTADQGVVALGPPLAPTAPPPPPGTEPPGGVPTATPDPTVGDYGYVIRLRTAVYLPSLWRGTQGTIVVFDPSQP
ncbi:MAG: hypothetical protein ABI780_02230 [Ardenticatenales bacterium]